MLRRHWPMGWNGRRQPHRQQEGVPDRPKAPSRRERRILAAALVEECQAFLAGSYADHLDEKGLPIPTWAWTNLLAHGSELDLHRQEGPPNSQGSPACFQWRAARSYLAREILDHTKECTVDLTELQRKVLIPLELELARSSETSARSDPHAWVVAVRTALTLRR